MSHPSESGGEPRARSIRAACELLLAGWQVGRPPSLEGMVLAAEAAVRADLFRELLRVEQKCRAEAGRPLALGELRERFEQLGPWAEGVIRELAAEPATRTAAADRPRADDPFSPAATTRVTPPGQLRDRPAEAFPLSPTRSHSPNAAPAEVGGYRVIDLLGSGGMGAVYLAEDPRANRQVAIKLMRPDLATRAGAGNRFLREARAAAAIDHENVVPVWHVGEDGGVPFLVMPHLRGESLESRMRRGPIPLGLALKVTREVAAGLAAAHEKGLVHRDVKPGNIWLEGDPDAATPAIQVRRVRVLDFGLARAADGVDCLTATGAVVGTPAYMSPEQANGKELDSRSDLFSLGAVLYHLLVGRPPFAGSTLAAIFHAVTNHQPPLPHVVNTTVPPAVSELALRLLSKDPKGRPSSAAAVMAELTAIETSPADRPAAPAAKGRLHATWRSVVYLLHGGRARWFRQTARRLRGAFEGTRSPGDRESRLLGEAVEIGLGIEPEVAWELFRAARDIPDRQFILAFPSGRAERLGVLATSQSPLAVRVCLAVSERLGLTVARDKAARNLARMSAAGGGEELIAHLEQCRRLGLATADFLAEVLTDRVVRGAWAGESGWGPFFAQFPAEAIPPLFEVHHTLGRVRDAVELAKSVNQVMSAIDLCLRSSDPVDIEPALKLAQRVNRSDVQTQVRQALAAALTRAERWADALGHYEALGDGSGQSRCHEHLGNFPRALETCPTGDRDRRQKLFDRCVADALGAAARSEIGPAVARFTELRRTAAAGGDEWADRRGVVERHRAALLAAARAGFENGLAGLAPAARRERLLAWSAVEEAAEEWAEAAVQCERTGEPLDRIRASQLWERDHQYGAAVRTLGPLAARDDVQLRVAELRAAGGDHLGAARVYEHLGRFADASRAYEEVEEFGRAADCSARHLGDAAWADPAHLSLLARAGRGEEAVGALVGRLDRDPADRSAAEQLRHFVAAHGSQVRSPDLRERAESAMAAAIALGLRSRFVERAAAWAEKARAETLARYAGIWGMDLGTSKSAVSLYDLADRRAVICPFRGQPHFPSTLAAEKSGALVVGLGPDELVRTDIVGAIERSKRQMGTGRRFRLRGLEYRPEEVAAHFIQFGRRLAEGFVGARIRERVQALARAELGEEVPAEWLDEPVVADRAAVSLPRAVVTIPAYFDYAQRRATRDAAEAAEVDLVRLVPEPTAACFSLNMGRGLSGRVLVVDVGAGTTDVSYLEVADGVFDVQQIFGDSQFGGSDFDAVLVAWFEDRLRRDGVGALGPIDQRRLRAAVEQLKVDLSGAPQATFDLIGFAGRDRTTLELTATELERVVTPLLEKLDTILAPAKGLKVDHLLLVGAPMRSPLIRTRIERVFGKRAAPLEDARTAVALGAGCNAGYLSNPKDVDLLLQDVVPFALGVLVHREKEGKSPFVDFHVRRGRRIPCDHTESYTTAADNQASVAVQVLYGLGASDDPAGCKSLAVFELDQIPPARAGEPKIEVTFAVDANGVLNVSAKNAQTGRTASHTIKDAIWSTPAEMDQMRDRIGRAADARRLRDRVADLVGRARAAADEIESIARDRADLRWQAQFGKLAGQPGTSWSALDAEHRAAMGEMFNRGPLLADQFTLALDAAVNAARGCREFVAQAASWDTAAWADHVPAMAGQGDGVISATERRLKGLQETATTFGRWLYVLTRLALTNGDPRLRLVAAHEAGEWAQAIGAFDEAFASAPPDAVPLPDLLRCLDGLARAGDRERYRRMITDHAPRIGGRPIAFDRLNEFCRGVKSAVAWVVVEGMGSGSGFLVTDRHLVTNRHVVTGSGGGELVPSRAVRVHVSGGWRAVAEIRCPADAVVDLAVLELAEETGTEPVRVGYTRLVEIGEHVIALGFPTPEGDSFDDNLLADHGIVNRIRSRPTGPELEIGLKVNPGMSGGPVFNDRGEVIGVVTLVRSAPSLPGTGPVLDRTSHAIAIEPLLNLLPRPWNAASGAPSVG